MKKNVLPAVVLMLFTSCGITYYSNFSLRDVERPAGASEKYGPVKIEKDPDTVATRYRFSDSLVDILFFITEYQVEFVLKNKADRSIKINWEKAAYVNTYGARKRVIHRGISYMQKLVAQAPTVIYKGATLHDYLLPSENVNVYLYGSGGWSIYPLLSHGDVGRDVQVLLPLEVDGVVFEYLFRIRINSN